MIGNIFKGLPPNDASMLRLADQARNSKQYQRAAFLYEEVLHSAPEDAAIHIQCGHMFKEAGDLARAEEHYSRANQLTPEDPDLALQLGHFYKIAGRLEQAEHSYKRAVELSPDWVEPAIHLAELYRAGWRNRPSGPAKGQNGFHGAGPNGRTPFRDSEIGFAQRLATDMRKLVPELAPVAPETRLHAHAEEISVRSLGRKERTPWGVLPTLRGVGAIRGFCISAVPILEIRAALNGLRFHSGPIRGFILKHERDDHHKRKYVFNIWYDFGKFAEGLHDLELHFRDENGGIRVWRKQIVVAAPLSEEAYANSDGVVAAPAASSGSLEEHINSRPSMVRSAQRARFSVRPKKVLLQRADQLGDLIISIPAIRRLRELLPECFLAGLLSTSNAELATTLNIFDEIVTVDFPDDEWERRRVMPLDRQEELRARLSVFNFDVAIDLAESNVSRPLLLLSGAPFLVGFKDDAAPWLSAGFDCFARDLTNDMEEVPPTAKALGLIEWFGAILHSGSQSRVIRRDDLSPRRLSETYGLTAGDRFAVLHTGARLQFSRWPYYDTLAAMILQRTSLKVVLLGDDPPLQSRIAPEILSSKRFQFHHGRLSFDDLDALLSFCTVFVGNDSGPAHLASLRGANVVNVYLARHNWNEWGHENGGCIVTRRVPCAGCNIHHDPEECGKDFACIAHIQPEEVFAALAKFL